MGPLFSLLLAGIVATAIVAVVFCGLRFKYSTKAAFVLAATFVGGAAIACILAVFAAALAIGVGATLQSGFAVRLYLSWLAFAGIIGGFAAVRCVLRWGTALF